MEENTYSYKLYGGKQLKKILSKEEQKKYLGLAVQGDCDAQEKILEHNLRLVSNIINKYYFKESVDYKEELFQVGSLGLWKAIQRFNLEFNVEFSTYAVPMILGEIKRYVRDDSTIRISRSIKDLSYQIIQLQEEYFQKNIELTTKQIAEILEESEEDIKDALIAVQQVSSLEEQVYSNKDGKSLSLGESIEDSNISIEHQFEEEEQNELIIKVLNSLGKRESLIVRKLFGIGCEEKTQMEIASEIGISQAQVSRIYMKSLKLLSNILPKYLNGEATIKELEKNTETEKTIFNLYENYNKKDILCAINSLNEENRKIIKLKYGINNKRCYSNVEIAKIMGKKSQQIGTKIASIKQQILKKLQTKNLKTETIFDFYPEYTEDEILKAINSLNERNKEIIEYKYGLNGKNILSNKEIAQKYSFKSNTSASSKIGKIKEQIQNRLKSKTPKIVQKKTVNKKSKPPVTIFELFPTYQEEQILGTISTLSEEDKRIMELKYGLNGNNVNNTKEISEELKLPISIIQTKISLIKSKIQRRLEKGYFKRETIFDLYPKYTEEQILGAIDTLTKENKRIIELKYGLNGNEYTETRDIANEFSTTVAKINSRLWAIKEQIEDRLEKGQFQRETIFNLYKGYTEEQILGVISTLPEEDKLIIEMKYGLNGKTYMDKKEIAQKLGVELQIIYDRLRIIKTKIPSRLEKGYFEKETIFSIFPEYTKEQVLYAISTLNKESKKIIELKYGLNGEKELSAKQIEEQYNVHRASARIHAIRKQIELRLIKNKSKTEHEILNVQPTTNNKEIYTMENESQIFEIFKGHSKEQILNAIDTLNETNKKIIELKYGLNGNESIGNAEIAKLLNLELKTVNSRIYMIKKQIEKKLNPKSKEHNTTKNESIFDLFPQYSEEEVLKVINSLEEPKKRILELKYGLNGKTKMKNTEIAEAFGVEAKTISSRIFMIKEQIEKKLSSKTLEQETIFDLFKEYTEEQVLDVINNLKTDNKQIIELKFGLNGKDITSTNEIAEQYGYTTASMSSKIYVLKKQIAKNLEKKFTKIKNEDVKTLETVNKNEEVEILNFDEEVKNELSYETKIKELEEAILQNKKIGDVVFKIGEVKVQVKVTETTCLLASLDTRMNSINRAYSVQKDCYVYQITAIDSKSKKLYEKFLIKDKKNEKIYNFVYRYTNGDYDISKIKYNELVCYEMVGIHVEQIYVKEPKRQKVISTPKPIIRDSNDRKNEEIAKKQEQRKELIDYKLVLEEGITLFKERQLVLAEEKFIKALNSKQNFVLQKSNYYLGKIYFMKKKGIIAEKYLKASFEFDNKSYPVLFEMGKTLALQHKYDEAIKCFSECEILAKPNYINHIIEKAKCYIELGNIEEGLKTLNKADLKHPNNYFVYYEKGNLLFNLNRYDEARIELEKCEKLLPHYARHKVVLGKIEYLENNFEKANTLFNEAVEIDLNNNVIYGIINIAYFFHKRGEKEMAYKYYSQAPKVNNWLNLSQKEAEEHIQNHNQYTEGQVMHSVFNFKASLDILNTLIKDMEKTATKEMFDVYQIHCENAGYMVIDGPNNTKKEDYITILTLPFTKTIANAYPDDKMDNTEVNRTVKLEWLINYTKMLESKKINNTEKGEQIETSNTTIKSNVEETEIKEVVKDEKITLENTDENNIEIIKPEEIEEPVKEVVEEKETTVIKPNNGLPINLDFKQYSEQIKMLINMLSEPTEQVVLLLRLGFINDKHYTEEEIAKFLSIDEIEVKNIINSSLMNIIGFSLNCATQKVEGVKEQLGITKNLLKIN